MKASQWLREYQLTGKVPENDDRQLAFWCGYLMGIETRTATSLNDRLEMAIRAAEFIEGQE